MEGWTMKHYFYVFVMLLMVSSVYAGDARVRSMGGETGLLPEDDSNIGLFPQRVNDWNILRIQDIAGSYYDFLLTTGPKGEKWAFYGSVREEDYLVNVIKSLGPTSAIDVGLQVMSSNAEFTSDGNDSELTANNFTLGLDLTYGTDMGDKEIAVTGYLVRGPYAEETIPGNPVVDSPFDYGKLDAKTDDQETLSAKASDMSIGIGAAYRAPMDFCIFDQMYGDVWLYSWSGAKERTEMETSTVDETESEFHADAEVWMFKNQEIMPDGDLVRGARLMYGAGGFIDFSSGKYEDKQSSVKNEDTIGGITLGGPSLRIGLEADIKFAQVRFGVQKDIILFKTESATDSFGENEDKVSESGIGKNGNLYINSGLGFTFSNLKIDLVLNKTFWESGPQMLFNDTDGNLSVMTDIIYTFPMKDK